MELVSIGKFAKMVGVTTTTLRRMHQSGDFIPHHVTRGAHSITQWNSSRNFPTLPKQEGS